MKLQGGDVLIGADGRCRMCTNSCPEVRLARKLSRHVAVYHTPHCSELSLFARDYAWEACDIETYSLKGRLVVRASAVCSLAVETTTNPEP